MDLRGAGTRRGYCRSHIRRSGKRSELARDRPALRRRFAYGRRRHSAHLLLCRLCSSPVLQSGFQPHRAGPFGMERDRGENRTANGGKNGAAGCETRGNPRGDRPVHRRLLLRSGRACRGSLKSSPFRPVRSAFFLPTGQMDAGSEGRQPKTAASGRDPGRKSPGQPLVHFLSRGAFLFPPPGSGTNRSHGGLDWDAERKEGVMDELQRRWSRVKEEIEAACRRSGRDPRDVRVVAVTKYVDSDTIRQVLDIGLKDIGESRVQEAVPKWEALDGRGTWHFIGHLQRNKVKDVVTRFTYIHSLDRFSLAEEINRRASRVDRKMRCFIQVNVSGEKSKFGLPPNEVAEFAREVAEFPYIQLEGLMTMAPRSDNSEEVRPIFRRL